MTWNDLPKEVQDTMKYYGSLGVCGRPLMQVFTPIRPYTHTPIRCDYFPSFSSGARFPNVCTTVFTGLAQWIAFPITFSTFASL